jgi:hypothetical protein
MRWPIVKLDSNQIFLKETNLFSTEEFNLKQIVKDISIELNVEINTKLKDEEITIEIKGEKNVKTALKEMYQAFPTVIQISLEQDFVEKLENDFEKIKKEIKSKISLDDDDFILIVANMKKDQLKKDMDKLIEDYKFEFDWKATMDEVDFDDLGEDGEYFSFEDYDIPPLPEKDLLAWMDAYAKEYHIVESLLSKNTTF